MRKISYIEYILIISLYFYFFNRANNLKSNKFNWTRHHPDIKIFLDKKFNNRIFDTISLEEFRDKINIKDCMFIMRKIKNTTDYIVWTASIKTYLIKDQNIIESLYNRYETGFSSDYKLLVSIIKSFIKSECCSFKEFQKSFVKKYYISYHKRFFPGHIGYTRFDPTYNHKKIILGFISRLNKSFLVIEKEPDSLTIF